jgi:tRNA1(Val) A37 N6-methylase TrmN6
MKSEIIKLYKIKPNPDNPRLIKDNKFHKLVKSIKEFPEMLKIRPIVVNEDLVVLGGNMRLKACKEAGLKEVHIIKASEFTAKQQREFIVKDNVGFGEWDWDMLANEWDINELEEWGLDGFPFEQEPKEEHSKLQDTFIVPPFSILDTKQGYWMDRKKYWKELINDNGESREGVLAKGNTNIMAATNNGVSILDPVLAEIANKWFGLDNCNTFDCFSGGAFGFVSDYLGNTFTGIELRQEQVDLNNARLKNKRSKYICDDGQNVLKHVKENSQDLLFSCPPYFDLEVYSDLENDASNQKDYKDFLQIIDNGFTGAFKCLKENRFAVIVVGDIRDKQGFYYGFPEDIKNIFIKNGAKLYNEMIIAETLGTLPQRVGRYMKNRKVGKCHQNVLVFYKGNPKEIKNIYKKLDFKNIQIDESSDI